jgi:hypothetical protein
VHAWQWAVVGAHGGSACLPWNGWQVLRDESAENDVAPIPRSSTQAPKEAVNGDRTAADPQLAERPGPSSLRPSRPATAKHDGTAADPPLEETTRTIMRRVVASGELDRPIREEDGCLEAGSEGARRCCAR